MLLRKIALVLAIVAVAQDARAEVSSPEDGPGGPAGLQGQSGPAENVELQTFGPTAATNFLRILMTPPETATTGQGGLAARTAEQGAINALCAMLFAVCGDLPGCVDPSLGCRKPDVDKSLLLY